jgi:chromate transport protein ChrA
VIAFVDGVTAAAVGAITGAVLVLGQRSIVDLPTVALFLATAAVLWRFKKLPEPVVVLAAALIGLVVIRLLPTPDSDHLKGELHELPNRPLTLNPDQLSGLSNRLITSHHENNYSGAVKRLNAIRANFCVGLERCNLHHQRPQA